MRTKQISKTLTAYLLCMAMILSCFGICQPSLKVKAAAAEQQTTEVERSERKMKFNDNWKFKLVDKYNIYNDSVQAEGMDYDDSGWDTVELPHDWAIYQEYENSNGVRAAQGALAGGVGWYRKSFTLSDDFKDKTVSIEFDGVYMISQVWVNGHTMDDWKQYLGYVTFTYDITKYLKFNGETNTIAVKVQSGNDSARWYAGAGIYRNVWLISTEKVNVPVNGVSVTTPLEKLSPAVGKYEKIENPTKAGVDIRTEVTNDAEKAARSVSVKSTIYDKSGDICATQTDDITIEAGGTQTVSQTIDVPEPKLWSVDSPNLYWVRTEVAAEGRVVDTVDTRFGIRYIALDPGSGFYLNGVRTQLNGVCEHSDLGALGMEVYQAAIDRRVRKLKSFGCNAVRTAHNPVSPEYIEACDRLGILVFEEAFDQWLHSKNNGDYSHYFNKASDGTTVVFDKNGNDSIEIKREDLVSNAERDIKAMVDRDKNSPAVFSWSTGNEIDDACYGHGMDTLKMLTGWIKEIDTTRPVAACPPTWYGYGAYNQQEQHLAAAEFSGYNYGQGWYDGAHERYPNMTIFGSETASAFYTRGVYTVGGQRDPSEYPLAWNFSSASYSIEMHRDRPYTAGEFVWTGHDYLGEPTPKGWPSKSSYFGIVDTAGFEKDAFYLYRSMWTDMPTVHILPQNWNYKTGDKIPVYIYTNAASVELFLNGKSLGVKNFDKKTASPVYIKWTDGLEYQAGELKAVGWDKANAAGNVIAEDVVYTSGSAQAVELSADRAFIQNDGRDLVFVEATIVDSAGIMVPDADNKITFQVDGGEIVAVNNGDPTDLDPFRGVDYRKAFSGKALVIVKADKGSTNNITVTATADSENGKLSSNTVTVGARTRLPGDGTGTPEFVNAAVTIGKGVSPQEVLPETVEALYSNGLVEKFKVTGWNLDALNINAPGQYQVTGTAEGLEGEFVCTITVKDIKQVKTVNVTTLSRVAPPLPKFVTIEYADGTVGAAPVTWDAVPEENYASAGTFTVAGSIGPELTVTANVAVKEVQSVASTSLETTIGTMPQLPTGVAVTFTDGTTEDIGVDWEIDEDDINAAGMVKITGKILGSEVEAEADVNVKYLIYASDLEWTKAVQEAGTPVKDQTVGGNKLKARVDQGGPPTPYDKGIGTLADSEIEYHIEGKGYESFRANISLGFDYGQGAPGAVVFKVYVDDEAEARYTSPVMTHASKNIPIDVDISDASRVRLVTEKAVPEGQTEAAMEYNLADWCDAKFVSGNITVEEVLQDETFFFYTGLGEIPTLFDTVEVKVDDSHTAPFHVEWQELTADMFRTPDLKEIEGRVSGAADTTVKAKVIVDYNNAMLDPKVSEKLVAYSMSETFDYVADQDAKIKISSLEKLDTKSSMIYKWTNNLLIENCTNHTYGFRYGVYPNPNNANPEYLIVRAPYIKSFVVRGTASSSGTANQNFTFFTSSDGANWSEFTGYEKTADTSWGDWPSRFYTADELPEDTHYLKIAFPTGNTWQFNLNEIHIEGGAAEKEGVYSVGLDTNGGKLPEGAKNKLSVEEGQAVGELPVPIRKRYRFKGWFTEKEGGEEITASYVPEKAMVIYAQWEKIPADEEDTIIYFVDSGAAAFTEEGKALTDDYADTIRNSVPDQAYDEASGWGFTNSEDDVETSGSGDAYTTIRNFKAKHNGLTMTYQFALDSGVYDVVAGFYDPWSQWAGDDRHAKITVADENGTVLASKEDHKITGSRETVTLEGVKLADEGKISLNLIPLKSVQNNLDSCDMLISFIVIVKKPQAVTKYNVTFDAANGSELTVCQVVSGGKVTRPENPTREGYTFDGWFKDTACSQEWNFDTDTVNADTTIYAGWTRDNITDAADKAGLRAALILARTLKAEDYTAESYEALTKAMAAAKAAYETEGLSAEEIQAQIDSLASAVRNLQSAGKEENEQLAGQLAEKEQELSAKAGELAEVKAEVTRLTGELQTANGQVTSLTEQLNEEKGKVAALTTQLAEAKEELERLKEEAGDITELNERIAELEAELEKAKNKVTELEVEKKAAEDKAAELEAALAEAKSREVLLAAENTRLTEEVQSLKAAVKKAEEEAAKAKEELEKFKDSQTLKKGDSVVVKGICYRVTDVNKKYAEACGVTDQNTETVTMASSVKIKGVSCKVTGVAKRAFANLKKVTKVTISKNVTVIGRQAFYGDKRLRTITVKSRKLKSVGKQALKGIASKAVIKVPHGKKKAYTGKFKGKGQKKSVVVK